MTQTSEDGTDPTACPRSGSTYSVDYLTGNPMRDTIVISAQDGTVARYWLHVFGGY